MLMAKKSEAVSVAIPKEWNIRKVSEQKMFSSPQAYIRELIRKDICDWGKMGEINE